MIRKTLRFIPVLASLALLGLVVAGWIRGYHRTDLAGVIWPGDRLQAVASHHGSVVFFFSNIRIDRSDERLMYGPEDNDEYRGLRNDVMGELSLNWHHFGFLFGISKADAGGLGGKFWLINLPDWFLALVLAIPPIRLIRAGLRRRYRRRTGKCPECGYDLRHSPERCPECGMEVTKKAPIEQANGTGAANR